MPDKKPGYFLLPFTTYIIITGKLMKLCKCIWWNNGKKNHGDWNNIRQRKRPIKEKSVTFSRTPTNKAVLLPDRKG